MIRAGRLSKDKFDAGRDRVASLSAEELAEAEAMNRDMPFVMPG